MRSPLHLKRQLEDLRLALAALADALAELEAEPATDDEERAELLDRLALMLSELAEASRELAQLRRDHSALMYDRMGDRVVVVPGRGAFERARGSAKERWESRRLLNLVLARAIVDPETGERLVSAEALEAITEALNDCLPVTASLSWRVTGLTARLGSAWRDLREREPGAKSVRKL